MSVGSPRREPSARQAALRTGAITVPIAMFGGFALLLSGVGGWRRGWVVTALLGAGAGAVVGWFGWGRRGRAVAAAVVAVVGVALAVYIADNSVWSHGRMWATIGTIAVPSDFVKVAESEGGNSLCFDECSSVTRTWLVPTSVDQAEAAMAATLRAKEFTLERWRPTERSEQASFGRRGHLRVAVELRTEFYNKTVLERVPVPADHVAVQLTLSQ